MNVVAMKKMAKAASDHSAAPLGDTAISTGRPGRDRPKGREIKRRRPTIENSSVWKITSTMSSTINA
jgi:hypothetical protein